MAFPSELELSERIRRALGLRRVELIERVQSLWGGYGELHRARLAGECIQHAVVKNVTPPAERQLARDAAELRSHRRKLRSYAVEHAFYRDFAKNCCEASCRVPELLYADARDERFLFVLEDLDHAGFSERRTHCSAQEIRTCLEWLAAFHARFLGVEPTGLWKVGTYWHLATRPDELSRLNSIALRRAAAVIDQRLNAAQFRTLVHGDAKLENFCFASAARGVAAVDFQYVGAGVGVKDVAYFLSSCLSSVECSALVPGYLDQYFQALRTAVAALNTLSASQYGALEREWRALFPWAWADFHRFLLGWAPSYAASDAFGKEQLELVRNSAR